MDNATNHLTDTTSATSVLAARQACKNIMYTVVNSRAYDPENLEGGLQNWQIVLIVADVVVAAVVVLMEIKIVQGFRRRRDGRPTVEA